MLPFAEDLDADTIHVQAPSAVVLICGGPTSELSDPTPLSIRDAFLKINDNPATKDSNIILSEDITRLHIFREYYDDFLGFETDLAQITELIILFCESEGSLAELGSFVLITEIASRMLVIARDRHWRDDSFVRLGPLRFLQREHGDDAVYVVGDADIGIVKDSAAGIKLAVLKDRLKEPVRRRLERTREPTTFDRNRPGHIIKLIVGLIQEYGALTIREVDELLLMLDVYVPNKHLPSYLFCAQVLEWIVPLRKGDKDYYFAANLPDAATIRLKKKDGKHIEKAARRLSIRDHWKHSDNLRYIGIGETFARAIK